MRIKRRDLNRLIEQFLNEVGPGIGMDPTIRSGDISKTNTLGLEIILGFTPAGVAIDAKDLTLAIKDIYSTGGSAGKLDATFATLGFIPGLGDALKGFFKMLRGVPANKVDDVIEGAVDQLQKQNPDVIKGSTKAASKNTSKFGYELPPENRMIYVKEFNRLLKSPEYLKMKGDMIGLGKYFDFAGHLTEYDNLASIRKSGLGASGGRLESTAFGISKGDLDSYSKAAFMTNRNNKDLISGVHMHQHSAAIIAIPKYKGNKTLINHSDDWMDHFIRYASSGGDMSRAAIDKFPPHMVYGTIDYLSGEIIKNPAFKAAQKRIMDAMDKGQTLNMISLEPM